MRIAWIGIFFAACAAAGEVKDDSSVYAPGSVKPLEWIDASPGPHLFVDDELIESSENLVRRVCQPKRDKAIPNPLVRGEGDRCFQPYFSVGRDPERGRWRMWYGASIDDKTFTRSRLAHMESDDGINWIRPPKILDDPSPIQFGSEVLDQGAAFKDPSRRYVFSYWFDGGLRIAVSGDGLKFRPLVDGVVLKHNHDITNVSWDELRRRYVATISMVMSTPKFKGERRTTLQSFSSDLVHWDEPRVILCAQDSKDEGDTQFYAMNAYLTRGQLRIGMVKVLRDDLFSDPKPLLAKRGGDFGIGYTTLAWTRDGAHWTRNREAFLERGPDDSWDRSHAWIDEQIIVGDATYLYYAGYRSGHKANRFTDRQIGLVKMPRDRYVSREPEKQGVATLVTIPIEMNGAFTRLMLNVNASGGSIRVRVRGVDELSFDRSAPMTNDSVAIPVIWGDEPATSARLSKLKGKRVQLEFELTRARLFSFEFLP